MDIEALIPHRGRMKLLDEILDINSDTATTAARVSERWPLYRGASVDSIVLIELVAQTAAVHISWKKGYGKTAGGRGWIVGIKSADFSRERIPLKTVLITTVKNLYQFDLYNVLEGEVRMEKDLLCRVQLQVFRSEPPDGTSSSMTLTSS
jgi:predicted hotdog family 3-hydroxylacyl-ACP dehydratase